MNAPSRAASVLFLLGTLVTPALTGAQKPAPVSDSVLERQFSQTVRPFVEEFCAGCHSGAQPEAQFNLKSFTTLSSVLDDFSHWTLLMERLNHQEMPPDSEPQPSANVRQQVIDWIKAVRANELRKHAGDPGPVLARRLSNAEYNYTIRDLTGVDLRPTKEFPVDPANQSGFDNTGESLTMSPALFNKYLLATREVADHMALTPDGFIFAPGPVLAETDRDQFAIRRIVDFYRSQPTDYADYFEAAWQYKHRVALGHPAATLTSVARANKVAPKYLPLIWRILGESVAPSRTRAAEVGPIAKLQAMWKALPAPASRKLSAQETESLRSGFVEMRDFVVRIRKNTAMQFTAPVVSGPPAPPQDPYAAGRGAGAGGRRVSLPAASQPLLTWKYEQFNTHRRTFDPGALRNDTDAPQESPKLPPRAGLHAEASIRWAAVMKTSQLADPDLVVPAKERARYEESFARFANVFPDTFYVDERGKFFPDNSADAGRLLSAGYHSVMGFWRDDIPLVELILDEKGKKELDKLWTEFDFYASHTARTFIQFYFNQAGEVQGGGAEAALARPVGREVTDSSVIAEVRDQYVALANASGNAIAAAWMPRHFDGIDATLRSLEKMRAAAEPVQLEALAAFAARAYRRPLTKSERDGLMGYYHKLRKQGGLSHEDAMRDSVASILISPMFLYRVDLRDPAMGVPDRVTSRAGIPLSGYDLASRLSYFLWSSMPDQELLSHAATGDLLRRDVLIAQTRRMLKDPRARGLATEFAANWLDSRHFETHNSVDRERFPSFTNDLREAMFEEPIRFAEDLIRNNRSVLDLLYGNYTFVNPVLANHYGIPGVTGKKDDWVRVDNAGEYDRGGLLPMAVFLTQSSPGLRTSPVKRGYWVVRRLLGEVIPPPPPTVPELPQDEAKTDAPLRDVLAQHRSNSLCAGCHARFDVFGLAMEGYGPVGEARTRDLAGRAIDASATFPGAFQGAGLRGVQAYIKEKRQQDFLENISRKLLSYALSRSLQLSDDPVVAQMTTRMSATGYRFGALVETIVTSRQFLNRRRPVSTQLQSAR
jgi:uncharacterized protein DUF1592/uncharacterized protein DUF1588/uncharacterized protein DUF1587/uncharacterized protein DUF1595/uncharacterized protein DUF1585